MKKLAILREDEVEAGDTYPVPVTVTGLRSSKLMSPPDYVLWLCLSELDEGGQITWSGPHSDQAVYVFSGELDVAGHTCPERGAVIIESDVELTVTATKPTWIGHWGSWDPAVPVDRFRGPIAAGEHRVHIVGPGGILAMGDPDDVGVRWFANAGCETCRIALFEVTRNKQRPGRPHSHSADEIIFLVDGTIELGAYRLESGTSLCIPGDIRYAEGSGPDGAVFINYRRESSDRTDFFKDKPPSTNPETQRGAGVRETSDVTHVLV
jgi:hypothetical protein